MIFFARSYNIFIKVYAPIIKEIQLNPFSCFKFVQKRSKVEKTKDLKISLLNYDKTKNHQVYYIVVNNYFTSHSGKVFMKVFPDFQISGFTKKENKN